MNRILSLILAATLVAGCVNHLPKPTNANGSINPSVAVAEAKLSYTNAANDAATYARTCHQTTPAPVGCSEATITSLKSASDQALTSINAAEQAVRTLQPGASGIDAAIANMNAALVFLSSLLASIHH